MSKKASRNQGNNEGRLKNQSYGSDGGSDSFLDPRSLDFKNFIPKNDLQAYLMGEIEKNPLQFMIGPAGTAKTFLAVAYAMEMLKRGKIDKIVAVRPAVESGDSIGFLTGGLTEKMYPYLRPVLDNIAYFIGEKAMQQLMKQGTIEVTSLTYIRGRTFNNCVYIGDEMQNATPHQLYTFLTRAGENCKMIVTMDPKQIDLPDDVESAAEDLDRFQNKPGIAFHRFKNEDVVRSKIVRTVLSCY